MVGGEGVVGFVWGVDGDGGVLLFMWYMCFDGVVICGNREGGLSLFIYFDLVVMDDF